MKIKIPGFLLLCCCVLFLPGCTEKNSRKLTIATAANMQFAMKELAREFTVEKGIGCDIITGSSGKLTAQIKEGAPFDLFVSADMKYPQEVFDQGLAFDPPAVYARGTLVLWTMDDNMTPSLHLLAGKDVRHIALANPGTAPYGEAAMEVMNYYHLVPLIKEKLVYGESITQTNQFIVSQSAEIGFTAKAAVLSRELRGKGMWVDIPDSLYTGILQGVVRIRTGSANEDNAREFYRFLFSVDAKKILQKFGYLVDQE